ncbi:MAG: ABC transporter substrate-binding protein [Acidimicrobiales bacterium]
MAGTNRGPRISRRVFMQGLGAATILAACGSQGDDAAVPEEPTVPVGETPTETTFQDPQSQLSGDLRILLWSHFVPQHDTWFDPFAQEWGRMAGVNVTVDHINNAEIPGRIAAEIAAGEGHDVIQYIAPLAQFEPSVLDLRDLTEEAVNRFGEQTELCVKSSFNPNTEKFYAYSPSWVPDPGDYRKSLWEQVDMPDGPSTWDDLLEGGTRIKDELGVQLGIGLSQEIDSNMAARALIWSFGGSIQDENENVVINSPEVVAAVEFMADLYRNTMTEEVFAWNAASNNQGLIAGGLSYIVNSISAWRTAQEVNPTVADDIFFVPALEGPSARLSAQHVMYNWIIPTHAANPDAAQEFLLHYTLNFDHASFNSRLYDFPAFVDRVPNLNAWLAEDPFGANPPDKLALLNIDDALQWTANIGHPGPANPAVGEVFNTFVVSNMMAKAARGEATPEQAVQDAEREIETIFEKWRRQGLVGGGQ